MKQPQTSVRVVPSAEPVAIPSQPKLLQRKCACGNHVSGGACAECSKKKLALQRKTRIPEPETRNHDSVPPIVHEVLRSPGQPLDAATREFFEPRFGYDFSQVQVHTDAKAAASARAVNALAYTVGRDVVFGAGQYAPAAPTGRSLLAHELTHAVQQSHVSVGETSRLTIGAPLGRAEQEASSAADRHHEEGWTISRAPAFAPLLQRLCSSAATCAAPVAGSVEEFRASNAAEEVDPRTRRKRMTPERAVASGHSRRARQLELFLEAQTPGRLAHVQGIFIDWDMNAAAMVQDCASWITDALPVGSPTPPGMAGATKPCMFVPGPLNPQALAFNTTSNPRIGGKPREEWRVETLQTLTHEVEHVAFDTAAHATPAGITTGTCTRANLDDTLSEMAAFMSEFPIVFRAIPAGAGPTHSMRRRMADWFEFVLKDAGNNFKGMLEAMGCQCECTEVDAFVRETFNFTSASWTAAEKNAFHTELRRPVWGLRWPF